MFGMGIQYIVAMEVGLVGMWAWLYLGRCYFLADVAAARSLSQV